MDAIFTSNKVNIGSFKKKKKKANIGMCYEQTDVVSGQVASMANPQDFDIILACTFHAIVRMTYWYVINLFPSHTKNDK